MTLKSLSLDTILTLLVFKIEKKVLKKSNIEKTSTFMYLLSVGFICKPY